jgi:hypothetical protein
MAWRNQSLAAARTESQRPFRKHWLSLEERERRRLERLAMLDEADASLERGEGVPITEESMKALAEDVKQRGRHRLVPSALNRGDGAPPWRTISSLPHRR